MAKTPVGEKREGRETEGRAKVPPIAGPMIVPIHQTNGITAYARAEVVSFAVVVLSGVDDAHVHDPAS